jgi:hypothetical protein
MAFDPCREWLGIDAVDLADPCRVLGLGHGGQDAEAIGRAADARLEALSRVAPGPFAKAHAALIAKVEEARDFLLAQTFTAAAMSQSAAVAPAPLEPPGVHVGSARWPGTPASSEYVPATESPDDEFLAAQMVGRPTKRARRASSGAGGLLLTSLALLAAAAALIVVLMLGTERDARRVGLASGQSGPAKPGAAAVTRPQSPVVPPPAASPRPAAASPAAGPPPTADRPESAAEPPPGDGADGQLQQRMENEPSRRDAALATQQAAAAQAAEEARRRAELQAAEAKQRAEQEQRQMQAAFEAALADAYAALQRGEFDTADRAIAAAEKRVGDDVEAATRLERWRLLATYARDFVGHRDQAFAAANAAGSEYTVEGKTFAVIEITPDKFIYRLSGRTERVDRERAPQIEMAIVEAWFAADGRPANHLFLGAHWLCLDPPNRARAKAAWRIAGAGGEQVEPLVALLDDPVILGAAR